MLNIKTENEYYHIVDEYSDMIFRIAYQHLFNTEDAKDVVQDVFVKLLKQKNGSFCDYEHLKAWLIKVTMNQCLDYKKSFFRKNTVPLKDFEIPYEPEERKIMEELDVPNSSKSRTTTSENATDVAGETAISGVDSPDTSTENKEKEDLAFEFEEYKSFTVNYKNQTNDTTCINVVDTSDIWSNEKIKQYKALNYDICGSSVEEEKEVCDFLTKDLGITCTVTYKDGSTETKNIVVTNDIVTLSDVIENERSTGKEHTKLVVKCFSIK